MFPLLPSTKTKLKHLPEFYESILEASDRRELWGISAEQSHLTYLEIYFNY